ncbi:hypothetical protein HPP92_001914 [Vanilla planifolia]|uniref:Uncharacterized protein n=1 Tax=Vanilla planifolia TaxID=51239 RepID=A0A835S4D8_VANPL|nr:hypothetical protein HPP92_001914 [Vanilla planifolia]
MQPLQTLALSSFSIPHLRRRLYFDNSSTIPFTYPTSPPGHRRSIRFSLSKAPANPEQNPNKSESGPIPGMRGRPKKVKDPPEIPSTAEPRDGFPMKIPRKPRRGRRSEAVAVEDFVRGKLEQVFDSIREKNPEMLEGKGEVIKQQVQEAKEGKGEVEEGGAEEDEREHVVEEEDSDWPLDADVGWGIRASEYFEEHPIKNVVVDGVEIDWEREMDEGWIQEINCLEWESIAFHPSPLIVLVFERYNRAADNWKLLKELEKAAQVYWNAKDRLPPRTVKIDMNIETDLAYALKVRECPEILFLKGNRIAYREKEMRTAEELVHMIAHFYYNAKRPSWIDPAAVASC